MRSPLAASDWSLLGNQEFLLVVVILEVRPAGFPRMAATPACFSQFRSHWPVSVPPPPGGIQTSRSQPQAAIFMGRYGNFRFRCSVAFGCNHEQGAHETQPGTLLLQSPDHLVDGLHELKRI